ncbi:hypothetical protein FQ707_02325 [Bacteroidaceae bacterium HV4-6-C5C]|nr:hypothetical protein FQ707_02325 [Bacteroidaceae bacterium HV4-6-C5C]
MEWYYYFGVFLSGVVLGNAIPHFVSGISGNKFPTPFAKPRGRGLSSSTINVLWGLFNLIIGLVLTKTSHFDLADNGMMLTFFIGITCISIPSSMNFAKKEKE